MMITVLTKDLKAAAGLVTPVSKGASPMPILNHVLISAGEVISFEATNMEIQAVATLQGTTAREGKAAVDASKLNLIAKLLPAQGTVTLDFDTKKKVLKVDCDGDLFSLQTSDPADFPEWAVCPPTVGFTIPQKTMKTLLGRVAYAMAERNEARKILAGVLLELSTKEGKLKLTATTGRTLAWCSTTDISDIESAKKSVGAQTVMPARVVEELLKVLGDEGNLHVSLSDEQFKFETEAWTVRAQALAGKYPNVDAVIPKDLPSPMVFDREPMLLILKRAGIVADKTNQTVMMVISEQGGDKGRGSCSLQSMARDVGSFSGSVPVNFVGPTLRIAFNASLFIETVSVFTGTTLEMRAKNASSPAVFNDPNEPNHSALAMPVKISEVPRMSEDEEESED